MKRLCFGGSFNPIHYGHLICARAAAEAGGFDKVILFPSAQPPHKPETFDMAPAQDRLAMCHAAIQGYTQLFGIHDLELRRPGASYTIDTVQILRAEGWEEVNWLIGADMLNYLPQWHRIEELVEEVEFYVISRPGSKLHWNMMPKYIRQLQNNVLPAPEIGISASLIRERVRTHRTIDWLTPQPVIDYIKAKGLYRAPVPDSLKKPKVGPRGPRPRPRPRWAADSSAPDPAPQPPADGE